MNGFRDLHRTYARTDKRELIGPNRSAGDQKWPNMAKIGRFWPKSRKREFFSKIRLEHFLTLVKLQICAKFQKNLMYGFPDILLHTDTRTNVN